LEVLYSNNTIRKVCHSLARPILSTVWSDIIE
jgi:hypothetical protein